MSASQEKKKRQHDLSGGNNKKLAAEQEAEKKKRQNRTRTIIYTGVFVLLVAFVTVVNSSFLYRYAAAYSIGDTSYNAAEVNYLYHSAYYNMVNQYGPEMVQMMGLDTSQPLQSQPYVDEESEYETWADYFRQTSLDNLQNMSMLCDEAEAEGYVLTDADKKQIDEAMKGLEEAYESSDFPSMNRFLAANYGKGVTIEMVRNLVEKTVLASSYSEHKRESFTYTDDELAAYYEEHKDEYDVFNYYSYTVTAETDTTEYEEGQAPSEEEAEEIKAGFMAAAKEDADKILEEDITDAESFYEAVLTVVPEDSESTYPDKESLYRETPGSSLEASYADWMKDSSREEGDTTVVETDSGYVVLYFDSRFDNEYITKNVRHILIKTMTPDEPEPADEAATAGEQEEQLTEEEAEAAALAAEEAAAKEEEEHAKAHEEADKISRAEIERIYDEWKSGDATEESFAELAAKYTEDEGSKDNGGLYENIAEGQMVPEFDAFAYDPSRKPGDTDIVHGESGSYEGYHLVYFAGDGMLYSNVMADNAKRSDDYTSWETSELEKYDIVEQSMARLAR